jgi:outer membrane lipoprotein-sorting protein
MRRNQLTIPGAIVAPLLCVAVFGAGCAVSQKRSVAPAQVRTALDATRSQLIEAYNAEARATQTLNATVRMVPVTGSAYSGVIEQYHDVGGFILAARPAMIRVIGQAPVVAKDIFDMVSDGQTFRIYIPSKNRFLVGPTNLNRPAKSPIENLRPQHILDAIFWPELTPDARVLFEESDESGVRYYVLTELREASASLEIARKIWFDRADLRVARVEIYGPEGRLDSDIAYSDWQETGGAATAAAPEPAFAHEIHIARPQEDYQLSLSISKLTLNTEIAADRFVLPQPAGTELVRVGEDQAQP